MDFTPGDVQILNNHTIAARPHRLRGFSRDGKESVTCCGCGWPAGCRKLPPVFAECYGGVTVGDRGGIICKDTRLHAPLVPA